MLQNDFFHITALQTADNTVTALLEINPAHIIFEGHFPGQPVVPGVCLMQMVKEITERVLEKELRLVKADQVKFLTLLIPGESQGLQMELKLSARESGETVVDARLIKDGAAKDATVKDVTEKDVTVFFKFKGLFV